MKRLFFSLAFIVIACSARPQMMTQESFEDIMLGTSACEITQKLGKPYAIHTKGVGRQEYEYVERFEIGNNFIYENHYFLTIMDGVVVRKRVTQRQPPAYDFIYQEDPNDLLRE